MNTTIEINPKRLEYLLSLFKMSRRDLLEFVNHGLKNKKAENELFDRDEIKITDLKRIDKVFQKGLSYYIDPQEPIKSKEQSIFFRKDTFNAELSLGARLIVNKYEEKKITFNTIVKLADYKIERKLPVYTINDNPQQIAHQIRKKLNPTFHENKRRFLESLIKTLADYNILVFEFVETWNKKEKSNISGFYLSPNVIVLKRIQTALRREIFTLAHELGHYLLNEEDIDDSMIDDANTVKKLSAIEKWCYDFAYYFLAGDYHNDILSIQKVNSQNNFQEERIAAISLRTHLSTIAIYTRIYMDDNMSGNDYMKVKKQILKSINDRKAEEKLQQSIERQKAKEEGLKPRGSTPKPIVSPLYQETLQAALHEGIIDEMEFCQKLNIKPEKLGKYM